MEKTNERIKILNSNKYIKGVYNDFQKKKLKTSILWIILIVIISFNLRPAITSVGPLVGMIRDDIGLSNWNVGLLTTFPMLSFALMSPLAPKLGHKFGNMFIIPLSLFFLFIGIITRSIPMILTLFLGTFIIGMSIAVMNVLMPSLIKDIFPNKVGRMTSIYTTSMKIFAAMASGMAIPLTQLAGGRWELSLIAWSGLAIIGIFIWVPMLNVQVNNKIYKDNRKKVFTKSKLLVSSLAWQVTLFMGLQSFIFYTVISWLPEILLDYGFTKETAGWMLFYVQIIGLPATFLFPIIADRFSNQKGIVLLSSSLILLGFLGLLLNNIKFIIVFCITCIGIGLGGTISLSLTLISLRASTPSVAAKLSGMAQSIGYFLAASGPVIIGLLYDLFNTWSIPFMVIILASCGLIIIGWGAGRNKYVLET